MAITVLVLGLNNSDIRLLIAASWPFTFGGQPELYVEMVMARAGVGHRYISVVNEIAMIWE